jgi:glycosyltransferase involved in cell wall biosynthesis
MIMIFGSIDKPFLFSESKVSRNEMLYGAWVAGESFYEALLKYGTFDEYHFFVDAMNIPSFKKKLSRLSSGSDKVKIIKKSELPSCLSKIKYTIFFSTGPDLSLLSYLRSQFAKEYFPLCGLTHTISYQDMLELLFFNNMISNLYPFDSIISTSSAQLKAMQNLIKLVIRSFKEEKGWILKFKGRFDQLPLGVNADGYGKTNKLEARKYLDLPKDKIIILYFGRFSIYDKMDIQPILLVFKDLSIEKRNIMLLLAGRDTQGKYAVKVEEMSDDMNLRQHMKLYLNPSLDKKFLLYSASDIFISPSDNIQESFGLTILEAMASGLPVVASDWSGYRDLVIPNETGFLIPTYWADCNRDISLLSRFYQNWQSDHLHLAQSVSVDVQKMSEYLSLLINNKELRLKFGQNARNRILKKYDWRVLIPEYENLWEKLFRLSHLHKIKKNKTRIFVPNYFECFSHYATKILDRKTEITITEFGISFLRTIKLPYIPGELYERISQRMVFIILTFLFKEKSTTMGEVESHAKKIFKIVSPDIIRYHMMWLLKKGFISLRR